MIQSRVERGHDTGPSSLRHAGFWGGSPRWWSRSCSKWACLAAGFASAFLQDPLDTLGQTQTLKRWVSRPQILKVSRIIAHSANKFTHILRLVRYRTDTRTREIPRNTLFPPDFAPLWCPAPCSPLWCSTVLERWTGGQRGSGWESRWWAERLWRGCPPGVGSVAT